MLPNSTAAAAVVPAPGVQGPLYMPTVNQA
jgi:hypothetical protein